MESKAACGCEAIERGAVAVTRGGDVVLALVEKDAGLLPVEQVGFESEAVHSDGNGLVEGAGEDSDFAREFFEGSDGGIVTGDDGAGGELSLESSDDFRGGAVHGLIESLESEDVVVAVDDEGGKAIRFAVDHAIGRGVFDDGPAKEFGRGEAGSEVDGRDGAGEHAQGDLRGGAVVGLADELIAVVDDADGVARF